MKNQIEFACFNIARDIKRSAWWDLSALEVDALIRHKLKNRAIAPTDNIVGKIMVEITND